MDFHIYVCLSAVCLSVCVSSSVRGHFCPIASLFISQCVHVSDSPQAYAVLLKVALDEAELQLTMSAANFITDVAIDPDSLPDDALQAGSSFPIIVKVQTEDGQPLTLEVALDSLSLRLTPPNGNRADVVTLQPSAAVESGDIVNEGNAWCAFSCESGELRSAGAYTVTAEHTEQRQELARALMKKEISMRSPAISFEVCSGPLNELQMEAELAPERVTVTNGDSDQQRQLLNDAVLLLTDAYGNSVRSEGVTVHLSLQWPEGSDAEANGGVLPELETSEGKVEGQTDRQGRVSFGAISIKQGTGKASTDENNPINTQGNAMACVLAFEVQASEHEYEG